MHVRERERGDALFFALTFLSESDSVDDADDSELDDEELDVDSDDE